MCSLLCLTVDNTVRLHVTQKNIPDTRFIFSFIEHLTNSPDGNGSLFSFTYSKLSQLAEILYVIHRSFMDLPSR